MKRMLVLAICAGSVASCTSKRLSKDDIQKIFERSVRVEISQAGPTVVAKAEASLGEADRKKTHSVDC